MAPRSVSPAGRALNDLVTSALRAKRLEQRLTLQQLANRTGIPLGSFSCLETGRYRLSLENLLRILLALGVGIQEVWPAKQEIVRVTDDALLEVIRAAQSDRPRGVSLDQILNAVAQSYSITVPELAGPSRRRDLAQARTVAALVVRDDPYLQLAHLGKRLGRDSSTLSHQMRRAEDRLRSDPFWDRVAEVRRSLKGLR